ncbi:hypothetical protein KY284_004051 [Solanum tuberosum]|nr:hypothetical protein KY284_004051 [Solanum tuberosum]
MLWTSCLLAMFFKIFGMAPAKKIRSLSKRQSLTTDISPSKDGNGDNAKKSLQRKKKLSDMLGPQWSEEDLTRFYQAYRKYGKDWKKVASAVKSRSAEMVEALYTMNRAYLSLPEGTASVAGLIAMMTDHYCNLAASDSEQESNEDAGTSRKFQNRARVKVLPNASKASEMTSSALAASHGCLTLLKKKRSGGSRPRAVGKRTPRFPVSFSYENPKGEKYFSPSRQSLKLQVDDTDDDVKIALVLTEASQRGGSPQVSKTPNRRTDGAMTSPIGTAERKRVKMEMGNVKLLSNEVDGEEGSMEADTGELMRYKNELGESGTVDRTTQKRKRPYGRKLEVDDSGDNHFDDIKEACSGTEEGQKLGAGAARGKLEMEATNEKNSRKRSKKVLFGRDESSAFDALQTLADLSLMMPTAENEDESMIHVKDEIDDHVDESGSLEAIPAHRQRDKRGSMGVKSRWSQPLSKFEVASSTVSKHGKVTSTDVNAGPETKQARRAQKAMLSKARKAEGHVNYDVTESQEAVAKEASKKSTNKGKRSYQVSPKLIKDQEHSSCADPRTERSDSAQSTAQIPVENQVNLPTKVRSRRKMDLKKPQRQKDLKMSDKSLDDTSASFTALRDKAFSLKKKISSCLSNHQVRRWCTYEWFYSAIDYPWFAKREFVEYLHHVGLGHVPRLTRVEWGVIRSSLGKPRRFSEQFLNEEKEKLNQYRESVRSHYTELREGTREGLPTDLARPLSVGQRVIAIHPKTREIHDGNVLTVDHSRCRVQFDRPELGVEFVMDIDCMPLNPFENMPTLLTRHADAVDKFFESSNELKMNARANEFMQFPAGDSQENGDISFHFSPPNHPISNLLKQTKVASAEADMQSKSGVMETTANQQIAYSKPSAVCQIQAKEADVQALAELTRALDKKDAVVSELRRMNDDVLENQKSNDCSLKDSEPFKKQYAAVLIQLNEVNEQVSSALFRLRQRNTYHGSIPLAWPRPVPNFADPSIASTFDRCTNQPQESGFLVNEIIENSKIKSRTMVDAAVQAMLSFTGRDNTTEKIEEAIDYVNDRILLDDSCVPTPPDLKSKNMSDRNEAEIPSELITKCVSTLLMIQKCTERQFPPADVAKVLDSAVASLQPCCSQNFPVYAEIQKCMRIIKNQILALVPT